MHDKLNAGHEVQARDVTLPVISIVIKTLNEEEKIGRCIESVLKALEEVDNPWEIIIADSVSSDRTVEIAKIYPVKVVQFRRMDERSCGAGVQLGYQHSRGEWVLLLDGDMELRPGFLPVALDRLHQNSRLAGIAGLVEDTSVCNSFDRYRVVNGAWNQPLPNAKWLNGGGLYRRAAITLCGGYASNRNLKGWEEAELGMRLTSGGWSLERIDFPSTLHTGHSLGSLHLLRSLWRSRRAMANGVLLRQAIGTRWLPKTVALLLHPLLVIAMWGGVGALVIAGAITENWSWLGLYAATVAALMLAFAFWKRSLTHALTSFALWHFHAASLALGIVEGVVPPTRSIDSVVLTPDRNGP